MRRSGLIHTSDDAVHRRQTFADQVATRVAKCGDEDELVLATLCNFAKWIVEQNGSRLARHELVRLLQDLAQNEIEIEAFALEGKTRPRSLEKTLELGDVERVELDHRKWLIICPLCSRRLPPPARMRSADRHRAMRIPRVDCARKIGR